MKHVLALLFFLLSASAFGQWDNFFGTRLNPRLAISGARCEGGEPSGVSLRLCRRGQWLITLDDVNRCQNNSCTEAQVLPFIAKLRRVPIITPTTISFYEIIPRDTISSSRRRVLSRYWVRFDLNEAPVVIRKTGK